MASLFLDFRDTLDEDFVVFGSALEANILTSVTDPCTSFMMVERNEKCQFLSKFLPINILTNENFKQKSLKQLKFQSIKT